MVFLPTEAELGGAYTNIILGIHSSVSTDAEMEAGHAWISEYNLVTGSLHTYGLWPGQPAPLATTNLAVDNELTFNKGAGYIPFASRYIRLRERELKRWESEKNAAVFYECVEIPLTPFFVPTQTCVGWVEQVWPRVTPESLDADDFGHIETPRELTDSILQAEKENPTGHLAPPRYKGVQGNATDDSKKK